VEKEGNLNFNFKMSLRAISVGFRYPSIGTYTSSNIITAGYIWVENAAIFEK
jgi:hypothetical protein